MARDWEKAVKKHYWDKMPKRIKELTGAAKMDLNFGPHSKQDFKEEGVSWPGYEKATQKIEEWADANIPSEIWYNDGADDISESEPQGWEDEETGEWHEPFLEETYHLEHRDIMRAVFGDLVGNGVG